MEKRWYIKYIGKHWVGCSHTVPTSIYFNIGTCTVIVHARPRVSTSARATQCSAPLNYVYRNSSGPLNLKIMKRAWKTSPAEQKNTVNYKTAKKSVRSAMSVHTAEHPPIPRDPRIQLSRVRTGGSNWRTSCWWSLWWWYGWSTGGVGWLGAEVGCFGRHRRAGSTSGSRLAVTRGTLLVEVLLV